jgi:hypothetical protein
MPSGRGSQFLTMMRLSKTHRRRLAPLQKITGLEFNGFDCQDRSGKVGVPFDWADNDGCCLHHADLQIKRKHLTE